MGENLSSLTLSESARLVERKAVSPVELVAATIRRTEELDRRLHAYITLQPERALQEGRKAEQEIQSGHYRGPLHGIPMGVKDLIDSSGLLTTYGSKIFGHHIPGQDANLLAKLKEAGSVLLGKLNCHEFAFGATSLNPHYGSPRNPWDLRRITGGSSGGSAAAVRAGMASFSIGTDTGGSIRIPAALCGIVGLKPTFGLVDLHGVFPLSWSLDHAGPMTRTVRDAALVLDALCPDRKTAFSARFQQDARGARGLCVGLPANFFWDVVDGEVYTLVQEAIRLLSKDGAKIIEVSTPIWSQCLLISSLILGSEAATIHKRLIARKKEEYDPSVKDRILPGFFITAEQYLFAQRLRKELLLSMRDLMQDVDVIVTPTTPVPATLIDQPMVRLQSTDYEVDGLLLRNCRVANQTGQPAISVPCGLTKEGLPVGLQFIGRHHDERTLLKAAGAYERLSDWNSLAPKYESNLAGQIS